MQPLLHLDRVVMPPPLGRSPLTLSIQPGERWAFLGPEACGKSTLLRLLAGLQAPAAGVIRLENKPLPQWSDQERSRLLGVLFQDPEPRFLTQQVWEEVALVPASRGMTGSQLDRHCHAALLQAGLSPALARRSPDTLSASQCARLALAAVLAATPRLLLADEPGRDLAPDGELALAATLQNLTHSGTTTVIFTSHPIRAQRFASTIIPLDPPA
ncbi:MAG: ATP-binding cassette domain-containing protein [Magnetococcus sp. DMHC-1]|nr:ATP-binding cassette domain-containing protein [Magnetococcales bacterium]